MIRIAALTVGVVAVLAASPAAAQFGNVFDNSPPRPPADVPNGFPPQPPPVQYPGQPAQQQYGAPPPPQAPVARTPSGFQSQPLPPPPGVAAPPPGSPPPVQRARVTPPPAGSAGPTSPAAQPAQPAQPPATADTPPQPPLPPDDSVVTETPTEKIENGRAVFAGLDKITGRTISFDAAIGETVQFGALRVMARACYTRPPTEATNTDAFVEVDEVTLKGEIKRIFTGWMFASSPGLHAVEHPIYDVWLTDCASPKVAQVAQPATSPAPGPAPAARPPAPRPRQTPPPRQQSAPQLAPGATPAAAPQPQ